jgi:hypothetical protein
MPDLGPIPDTVSGFESPSSTGLAEPADSGPAPSTPSPFAPRPSSDWSASESATTTPGATTTVEPESEVAPEPVPEPETGSAPRKRVPGAAIASGRDTIAAVEEGAFRRLPTSDSPAETDHSNRALERREAMSRLQAAVEGGRQETGADAAADQDPERSDI